MRHALPTLALFLLLVAQCAPESLAAEPASLRQGIVYFEQGQVLRALPLFQQATRQQPKDLAAQMWLARAYFKQGGPANLKRAQAAYQAVLALDPNHVEALATLGEMASWTPAQRRQALDYLSRAVAKAPNHVQARRRLTEVYAWEARFEDAKVTGAPLVATYRKAPAQHADWLATYADSLAQSGQPLEALPILDQLLALPQSKGSERTLKLHISRAMALALADQAEAARPVYATIQSTLPAKPSDDLRARLSALAYQLEDYPGSLALDAPLPAEMRNTPAMQLRRARALAKSGQFPEAIAAFQALNQAGLLGAAEKLEFADYLINQPDAAANLPVDTTETLIQQAVAANPRNAQAHLRLARYYGGQPERYADAVQAYSVADALDPSEAEKEFFDFLRADRTHLEMTDSAFQQLMTKYPERPKIRLAYADFLSVQESRRADAIQAYVALLKAEPGNTDARAGLDQVLGWHRPIPGLESTYREILQRYPDSTGAQRSLARLAAKDSKRYTEALTRYQTLRQKDPSDGDLRREYLGLLASSQGRNRREALRELASLKTPDTELQVTYGKLLSYERRFADALTVFEQVLRKNPKERDALLGKGYALLWGGEPLAAKRVLNVAKTLYPDDVEIGVALAETERILGRPDRSLDILQELRPRLNHAPHNSEAAFRLCVGQGKAADPGISDASVLPPPAQPAAMTQELDALKASLETLKTLQAETDDRLHQLHREVDATQDALPTASVSMPTAATPTPEANLAGAIQASFWRTYDLQAELRPDGTTQGGLVPQEIPGLKDLQRNLNRDLRPILQSGFGYLTQEGNPTTNELRSYGYPNQLSIALLPNVRVRGGITPRRFYLPTSINNIGPKATWSNQYSIGASAQVSDRLLLDGDLALTQFFQSDSTNLTYQAFARYDVNDRIRVKLGSRRDLLPYSLLAYAGIKPSQGAFAGDLVGQARENAFSAELTLRPFRPIDWNLGYEWAFVEGENIPTNYKNQAYSSLGYTHRIGETHSARLAYEFLYFGYSKNATNGFFDPVTGVRQPVLNLSPVQVASPGTVFGGYFSPDWFILNALRLDLRGSFFNKFLEYRLGGSIGIQAYDSGPNVSDADPTTMASQFDASLLMNVTNWLGLYGNVDFLDAGGLFSRWRFGGGVVVRPNIPAVSPVLGKR